MAQTVLVEIPVKQRAGMALALSGGGYRASLFHLGVLRRLNELDLLRHIDAISSVSGGSITNALLAKTAQKWKPGRLSNDEWNTTVRNPVVAFCKNNIRTVPVLLSFLRIWKKGVAVNAVEKRYHRLLTDQTLGDLPESVDFIFCASDIVFSTIWYYRRKTSASRRTGNYRVGWLKNWKSIPVAQAVAASSCFPPVFSPQILGRTADDFTKPADPDPNREKLIPKLRLSDGGVYDNLGLEPVWDAYKYVIASDGGKPTPTKASRGLGQFMRYSTVIQAQVSNLRRRMLMARDQNPSIDFSACYLGIHQGDKPSGYSVDFVRDVISEIRTDLDTFSDLEASVLENHCYTLADHYLKKYLLTDDFTLPFDKSALNHATVPHPELMDESDLRKRLKKSDRRTLLFFTRPGFI